MGQSTAIHSLTDCMAHSNPAIPIDYTTHFRKWFHPESSWCTPTFTSQKLILFLTSWFYLWWVDHHFFATRTCYLFASFLLKERKKEKKVGHAGLPVMGAGSGSLIGFKNRLLSDWGSKRGLQMFTDPFATPKMGWAKSYLVYQVTGSYYFTNISFLIFFVRIKNLKLTKMIKIITN